MVHRSVLAIILTLLLVSVAHASDFKPPKLTPVPSTEAQTALIQEGIALHDKGQFDEAIDRYEKVLAENPANVLALYELAYSYSAKKEYRKALELATRGAEYKSPHLHGFYVLIGNNLDLLGESKKAIEAYEAGIELAPDKVLLHFNLAVTQSRLGKAEEAKTALKRALSVDPKHRTSHLMLSLNLMRDQYRVPALLAALRFLTLEPATERSDAALDVVRSVLAGGVSAGDKPNEISITLDPKPRKEEGDFAAVELFIGVTKALGHTEEGKRLSEAERLVEQVDSFLGILSETEIGKGRSMFVSRYYVPYFVELKRRGYVEPFVYYTFQKSGTPGVTEWLQANPGRVKEFLAWSDQYAWPQDADR